jgi:hypothetical protein
MDEGFNTFVDIEGAESTSAELYADGWVEPAAPLRRARSAWQ